MLVAMKRLNEQTQRNWNKDSITSAHGVQRMRRETRAGRGNHNALWEDSQDKDQELKGWRRVSLGDIQGQDSPVKRKKSKG